MLGVSNQRITCRFRLAKFTDILTILFQIWKKCEDETISKFYSTYLHKQMFSKIKFYKKHLQTTLLIGITNMQTIKKF